MDIKDVEQELIDLVLEGEIRLDVLNSHQEGVIIFKDTAGELKIGLEETFNCIAASIPLIPLLSELISRFPALYYGIGNELAEAVKLDSGSPDKFIVTKNNPHYPDVEYCNALEEAQTQRDTWIKEMFEEDGQHECKITIAKVIETAYGKSYY